MFFELKDAIRLNWKCPECSGVIKKGVYERVLELSDSMQLTHPDHRPKCIYIIPLSEIIALALRIKSPYSLKVKALWKDFIDSYSSEVNVLLNVDINKLKKIDENVAEYIDYFRNNKIQYIPGGAGVYGKLVPPGNKSDIKIYKHHQKSLQDFKK